MAILGKGPGPKKKDMPKSKIGTKGGQTVAAPGYAMGLIRNQRDIKTPTKSVTIGSGPAAVTRTQQQGIIGPKPLGKGGKSATPAKPAKPVKWGRTAVGQALYDAKEAAGNIRIKNPFQSSGGGRRRSGGRTCAAYRGVGYRR